MRDPSGCFWHPPLKLNSQNPATKREGPMCLVGVWKVSNRCQEGIRIMSSFGKVSGRCVWDWSLTLALAQLALNYICAAVDTLTTSISSITKNTAKQNMSSMIMSSFRFVHAWAMSQKLYSSCGIPPPIWKGQTNFFSQEGQFFEAVFIF